MKKLFLITIYFLFTGAMITSQVTELKPDYMAISFNIDHQDTLTANVEKIRLDSTNAEDFNSAAWNVANVLNGYAQFIPGIPNVILQTITGIIIGLIVRHREKKKLRKKGVLNDLPVKY